MQLRELREYCAHRGFEIVREYVDAGVSGAKESRPALNELVADARKRRFDAVLVWRFDRFARSTSHLLRALEEFRALGVQFISYQENIDTTTPLGQALFTIVSAVATLERDLIRERVAAGLRNARAKGKVFGRRRVPVDVARVAGLRAAGLSWLAIAQQLGVGEGTVRRTAAAAGLLSANHPAQSETASGVFSAAVAAGSRTPQPNDSGGQASAL